jgi:hypothetical protein
MLAICGCVREVAIDQATREHEKDLRRLRSGRITEHNTNDVDDLVVHPICVDKQLDTRAPAPGTR